MSFSCNGDANLFSDPVDFVTDYNGFSIQQDNYGCTSADGDKNVTVKVTDEETPDGARNSDTIKLDTTGPVISNQTPANGTHTKDNRIPIEFDFSDAGIGMHDAQNQLSLIVNGTHQTLVINGSHAKFVPDSNWADGTINVEVGALDDLYNDSNTSWSFEVDTVAHLNSVSVNGGATYAESVDANMSAAGDGDLAFCRFKTTGDYGDWIAYSSSMHISLSSGDGSKTVTGQCKDEVGNSTIEEQSDSITLDATPPDQPQLSIFSVWDQTVSLHWNAVSDATSGLKEFVILKDGVVLATLGTSTLDYNATGLTNGTQYTFRLIARDNAGNESFDEKTATPQAGTGNPNNPNNSDTTAPTVRWLEPDNNATVGGIIKLRVRVNDVMDALSVYFYLDSVTSDKLLQQVFVEAANDLEWEWDATGTALGAHSLYAKVVDAAGNASQAKITINLKKVVSGDQNQTGKQDAQKALEEAKSAQKKAKRQLDLAKQFALNVPESESKYLEGSQWLEQAGKAFVGGKFAETKTKSISAKERFNEIETKIGLLSQSDRLLGEPTMLDYKGIFLQSKLNPVLANLAGNFEKTMHSERHLIIFKRTDGNNTAFFARVELQIKNNSDSSADFVVVELVPKVLAPSSDSLVGQPEFVILEKDPLLEWKLDQFKPGEERTLSYGINHSFSEQEIQKILESRDLSSFRLAPLIITADSIQKTPVLLAPLSILGLEILGNPTFLAALIGLIVVIAAAFFFWQKKKQMTWPK